MHTIRLRGPWQVEPIERYVRSVDARFERSAAPLLSLRATMPSDWGSLLGDSFLGRVRYHRHFQKPTGLVHRQRVWLVVESPRSRGIVGLNDYVLGIVNYGDAAARFDIAELLYDHNLLEILVDHPALDAKGFANEDSDTNAPGGLVGEVRLEIEE